MDALWDLLHYITLHYIKLKFIHETGLANGKSLADDGKAVGSNLFQCKMKMASQSFQVDSSTQYWIIWWRQMEEKIGS